MIDTPVYLDYNGTTPLDPGVVDVMVQYLKRDFGNPSSRHYFGIEPKKALIKAREQVSSLINCTTEEIIFTSGGTESNNHAIFGTALAQNNKGRHIITSEIEHPAVLEVCRRLEADGYNVTYLPVDATGLVNPDDVIKALKKETILITLMHSNNETGTIQPIEEISEISRERGIVFHTDTAQSCGKVPIDVDKLNVDLLSIAGHKLYAPKGVGALYVREGVKLEKFMLGAGQEGGWRAGTENVSGIAGLGAACEIAGKGMDKFYSHMIEMRDRLYDGLKKKIERMKVNGDIESGLPNTLNLSFHGIEANRLLEEIGLDVAASAGAACHADTVELSHVLTAMNIPLEWAKGTLRFTTGRMTSIDEIDHAVDSIAESVNTLRTEEMT